MRGNRSIQTLIYNFVIGMLLVFAMQGCLPAAGLTPAQEHSKTLKDVEKAIAKTKYQIEVASRQMIEHQQGAAIAAANVQELESEGADRESIDVMKQAIKDEQKDAADRAELIEQLKNQLTRLERERQTFTSQAGGCFLPDTLVTMADGSMKAFERIQPGDQVLTYDVGYQSLVKKPVVDVYTVEGNHLYTINGEISTTGTERFLSDTGWKRVQDLEEGDQVHVDGRMIKIVTIDYHRSHNKLYNMQVDDSHSFYVVTDSGTRYLVHNCGGGGGGGK